MKRFVKIVAIILSLMLLCGCAKSDGAEVADTNGDGKLTCTYPAYDGGWQVTAAPDGTLTDANGQNWLIYYAACPGDMATIKLPTNFTYTVSGDNEGGIIVCESADEGDVFGGNEELKNQFNIRRVARYGAACVTILEKGESEE